MTMKQIEDQLDHNENTAAADPFAGYSEQEKNRALDRMLDDMAVLHAGARRSRAKLAELRRRADVDDAEQDGERFDGLS